jgi:hypothetical protein
MREIKRRKSKPFAERFWVNVNKHADGGCWEWLGALDKDGYGVTTVPKRKYMRAHRAAWMLQSGSEPPSNAFILHSCDNPRCVNTAHLSLGNHTENWLQRNARQRSGTKLTPADAELLKLAIETLPEVTTFELARVWKVTERYVRKVKNGEHWSKTGCD